ncbi:hypothetical protein EPUS_01329 [Endocarpon pusillum Z07020]|uniref:Clr5 domain-containing protein n=1 Tax=Endocarpon pusillum (strain Z07020 / HMAS-L-300199) TaxID=1263415 RepID=U1GU44_ENDPU|nr:uncharacterized protein EPUS_01329 [Endocarpon pusillum Z07020]ERF75963.1 hypothetical protein EPUS_01329 [Endocarpon pusillum Z07020]
MATAYLPQENERLDRERRLAEREAAVHELERVREWGRGHEQKRVRGSFSGTYDDLSIAKDAPGYGSQASQPDVFTSLNADLKVKPTLLKEHERQNHSADPEHQATFGSSTPALPDDAQSRFVPTGSGVQYTHYTYTQWQEKRDIITQLYLKEDRMYRRKLEEWDIGRRLEMSAILLVARQRQAAGQESAFWIRGRKVDMEEVRRYFEARGEDPDSLDVQDSPIPSTITVETPPPNLTLKHDSELDMRTSNSFGGI